jgi:predicted regulator of Ras-like GTPase activity (Roadblock/LC7/MglB family)
MALHRSKSSIPPAEVEDLQGSLAQTNIIDLLQFLHAGKRTGELICRHSDGSDGRAYFSGGALVHVVTGDGEGMEALVEVCAWERGSFRFSEDVLSPRTSIEMPVQHAIMEAVRLSDERQSRQTKERSEEMMQNARTSADVLEDFLKVPGVTSATVVGRDGFLIESAGGSSAVKLEDLGASLAHAINGVEEMGAELQVSTFEDLFVEYGRAVIMCRPVGDAIIAIVAPDASKLGIIRHKVKPLVDELGQFF